MRPSSRILIALALCPLSLSAISNPFASRLLENNIDPDTVKEGLRQLAELSAGNQARLIDEEKPKLSSEALLALYEKSGENGPLFLKQLLKSYYPSKEERQQLINNLEVTPKYNDLLKDISTDKCKVVAKHANPEYYGSTPIVDWLNTAHFSGFFNPTMTNALANRSCHNDFDTFNQWDLWIEPFGFSTRFRNEPQSLNFDQLTLGFSLGGEYTFYDRLVLGLGFAYSHSRIDWKKIKDQDGDLNSFYFGPALNYVFSHGYLGCTLFGVANFYDIDRKADLFPGVASPTESAVDYTSWDLVLRLEGGLSFSPGYQFFLYPIFKIDYLTVFENGAMELLDEKTELEIEGFHESFFSSKLGVKMTREFYTNSLGFVIPSLSFSWLNFSPASLQKYTFHIQECKDLSKKVKPESWIQYSFGTGLSFLLKQAILFSLDYEYTTGADSPMQAGSLRFELSW